MDGMALLARLDHTRLAILAKQNVYEQLLGDTRSTTAGKNDVAQESENSPLPEITMQADSGSQTCGSGDSNHNVNMADWHSDSMCLLSPLQSVQGVEFHAGRDDRNNLVHHEDLPRLSASLSNFDNMAVFAADLRTSLACLEIVRPVTPLCASGVDDAVRYAGPRTGDVDQSLCTWPGLGAGGRYPKDDTYITDTDTCMHAGGGAGGRYPKDDAHGASTEQSEIPLMLWDSLGECPGSLRSSLFSSPAPLYAPFSPARIEADADAARNHLRQRLRERAAAVPQQNSESIYLVEFMENGMEIPCLPTCTKDPHAESAEMHMGRVGNLHEFDWVNVNPSAFRYYITQPKDTVRKIAKKHKLECSEIIERNQHIKKLKVTSKMHEGIIMRI